MQAIVVAPVVGATPSCDNPRMRQVKRSALIAQPPSRMFALINDIESYPAFVPGCTHSRVESRTPREIVATLGVRKGPLRAELTTRNVLEPDRKITMSLVKGPFKELDGEWTLTPAYDLTFARGQGFTRQHQMRVADKQSGITRADLVGVGKTFGLRGPEQLLEQVIDVVGQWATYAGATDVPRDALKRIQGELDTRRREIG